MCSLLKINLKRFFTCDSVRPSMRFAISLHLLPTRSHFSKNSRSSLSDHWLLLIEGSSAVSHLSLHCLPFLAVNTNLLASASVSLLFWMNSIKASFNFSAILDQSLAPLLKIRAFKISSSFLDHLVLLPPSFWMNNHLLLHFFASLVGTISAIYSQS